MKNMATLLLDTLIFVLNQQYFVHTYSTVNVKDIADLNNIIRKDSECLITVTFQTLFIKTWYMIGWLTKFRVRLHNQAKQENKKKLKKLKSLPITTK